MSEEEWHWSRDEGLNRFAGITFFVMAVMGAAFHLFQRHWIRAASYLLFAGLLFWIYWTAIRPAEQRKKAERLAAGDLFGPRTEGERVAAGDVPDQHSSGIDRR